MQKIPHYHHPLPGEGVAPLRFKRVEPHPGETRRYVTSTDYGDGTYIITRERRGGWAAWVIEGLDDPAATLRGWRCIARGQRTMSGARIGAQGTCFYVAGIQRPDGTVVEREIVVDGLHADYPVGSAAAARQLARALMAVADEYDHMT